MHNFYNTFPCSLINTYSCSKTPEKQNKQRKTRFCQIAFLKYLRVCGDCPFYHISCCYTDLEKVFAQSGNNTESTETYRSCLALGEHLVCKINHDQVSAEQKLVLTKVHPDLFLMLINPIASKLTVPNGTVIP